MDTRLYECELGAATYWVSAENVFRAAELLKEALHRECGEPLDADDFDSFTIDEITSSRGEKLRFHDGDGTRSMWAEFERDRAPRFIASSTY